MTGQSLIDDFSLIILKTQRDIYAPLTAPQLSAIVTAAETLILNEVSKAPCGHFGSRYQKEGEDCNRSESGVLHDVSLFAMDLPESFLR